MKKLGLLVVLIAGFLLSACAGQSDQYGFWSHDSMYASPEHMKFSITGYTDPGPKTGELSQEQSWWGQEIPYIPAR